MQWGNSPNAKRKHNRQHRHGVVQSCFFVWHSGQAANQRRYPKELIDLAALRFWITHTIGQSLKRVAIRIKCVLFTTKRDGGCWTHRCSSNSHNVRAISIPCQSIMATVQTFPIPNEAAGSGPASMDRHGWGFAGLLCVVGALFIRPTDFIPQFRDFPIYQGLIVTALVLSYNTIANHLKQDQLSSKPVTCSLMLFILAVAGSHLYNGLTYEARESSWMAVKLFALYLLMVSVIYSKERLEIFLRWLLVAITFMSSLAIADHYGVLELDAFTPLDDRYGSDAPDITISRIRGSGIFEDPNDLGLVTVLGLVLAFYFVTKRDEGWKRYAWLLPGSVLMATLYQTHSRGAFLAMSAAVPAWLFYYRGWRTACLGSVAILPVFGLLLAGRMTDINSVYEGTGQTRIQIWSETFDQFRNAPIFGIGEGKLVEELELVSHNSYLQNFAELGFIGGTLFLGAFVTAIVGLVPDRSSESAPSHLHGAVFAALIAYCVGIFTLSRQFVAPTFLMLGMATAGQMTNPRPLPHGWRFGNEWIFRSCAASLVFLGVLYFITRFLSKVA
jgi:hypothetical protein